MSKETKVGVHKHATTNIQMVSSAARRSWKFSATMIGLVGLGMLLFSSTARTAPRQDPPGMKWISGGTFTMGTDSPNSMPNERPAHEVKIDGFWLDEHTVTNSDFRKFIEATGYITIAERPVDWEEIKKQLSPDTPKPPPEQLLPGSLVFTPPDHSVDLRDMSNWWTWTTGANWKHPQGPQNSIEGKDNFPVVQISWDDAAAYAKWAGKRLPTEAEWEYAARAGTATRYYWGDNLVKDGNYMANTFTGEFPYNNDKKDKFAGAAPVKSFPPNKYGLYDMAGNVWQWTADFYRADVHAKYAADHVSCENPKGPTSSFNPAHPVPNSPERVIKGGSFLCNPEYCESYRPSARRGSPPDTGSEHVGFRCAKSATM